MKAAISVADQQLLTRLRQGEPQAVQEWFGLYHDKLLRIVNRSLSNSKDAEELVQETFINCLKHLPLFRGESSIWTWMQRIAKHEIADYYRKQYAKKAIKALPLSDLILSEPVADAHDLSEKVKEVLKHLSQESQELLMMKYVDGKKVQEIAHELNRSIKAIESDLFRARQEFRRVYVQIS